MKSRRSPVQSVVRKTFAYARCSTDTQAEHGVSIDLQTDRIAAYASAMGWTIDEVVCDPGHSAKSLQRPGMGRILEAVRKGQVERIIVLKLDRLTRSIKDLGELLEDFQQHDVSLVSITETLDTGSATGRLVTGFLGLVSQWEREQTSERTVAALGFKRRQGQVYGPVPFGYERQGDTLIPNPEEQTLKAQAIAMHRAGLSFREVGRFLTEKTNRVWGHSSVRAMLRSRIVAESAA